MIEVAHVITGLGSGGAEGFLARLLPGLRSHAIGSSVISLTDEGVHADLIRSNGFDVVALGLHPSRPDPRRLVRLRRLLQQRSPGLVMTWLYHADLIGGIVARSARIPVVWNVRQSPMGPEAPRAHHALERLETRLAGWLPVGIVCVSDQARSEHIQAGFPAGRMRVIHNGFDVERFRPDPGVRREVRAELGVTDDAPLIGYVARVHPQKDHLTAVLAFARLLERHPSAHLLLAGDGTDDPGSDLGRWIDERGLAGRVHRLGRRPDVERIDAALDVAISASAYGEGVTNALAEAMAADVPVVSTDLGDNRELIGDTGIVVPPRDPSALSDAISDLLSRDGGPSPRDRVLTEWTLEASVARYATYIRQVVERG